MKYKIGDIVWSLDWRNSNRKGPHIKFIRHKITELVEDFRSAPYFATYPGYRYGYQFHSKSVLNCKNEAIKRAIKQLEKEIDRLKKELIIFNTVGIKKTQNR